jgi:hypothetical protein
MSASRLSEIERGGGSFTAEQLVLMMRLFNVPVSHFVNEPAPDRSVALQNALARFGASHLRESTQDTPSEQLDEVHHAIREALLEGSPRLITALAPVLVRNIDELSLSRLQADATAVGYQNRLGWVVENTLIAIYEIQQDLPRDLKLRSARLRLASLLNRLREQSEKSSTVEDILDATIRSERTLDQARTAASPPSTGWNVVTTIQPGDFINALRAGLGVD